MIEWMRKIIIIKIILFSLLVFVGCTNQAISPGEESENSFTNTNTPTITRTVETPAPSLTNVTRTPTSSPMATQTATITSTPVYFSGAGDISICGQIGDEQTAAILTDRIGSGLYFSAGDNSNENGLMYEYINCFGSSWGQLMPNLRVVPGNHDYYSNPIENYYKYFEGLAGEAGKGWYSFDHGNWHIVMLNSNCGHVGCGPTSKQVDWLNTDLAISDADCSMAIWHHPRYNSGIAGNADWLYSFWDVLYAHGVDIVVNGHDHHYERMAKINPKGEFDLRSGIRAFIVGTGGASFYGIDQIQPFSEVRITDNFGVIQFELQPKSYIWQFINVDGEVMDQGSDTCSPNKSLFEFSRQ
jgi:hypothetical protein